MERCRYYILLNLRMLHENIELDQNKRKCKTEKGGTEDPFYFLRCIFQAIVFAVQD